MTEDSFSIRADSLAKRFYRTGIFRGISFRLERGEALALTGPNGSGKSTLLEIIAGLQRQSAGSLEMAWGGRVLGRSEIFGFLGFMSPRMNLYGELNALEIIHFTSACRRGPEQRALDLLDELDLTRHGDKPVARYSSGMRQRLKFLLAVFADPPLLLLDEPGSNLDRRGKDLVYGMIRRLMRDRIVIIAANEEEEMNLCGRRLALA